MMDANQLVFQAVYDHAWRINPELGPGLLLVNIGIDPDGHVSRASIESSTFANPALESAVLDRISKLQFPARNVPSYTASRYPIRFDPRYPAMSWEDRVVWAIRDNWLLPPGTPKGLRCKVRITLTPEGNVKSNEILAPSGNDVFDNSILLAMQKAQPLPMPENSAQLKPMTFMLVSPIP
jgi:TonB family protein